MTSVFELLHLRTQEKRDEPINTGCKALNDVLNYQNIACDGLIEVFGEAGSGKTQICLQLVSSNVPAIYISTEGESPTRRLRDIMSFSYNNDEKAVMDALSRVLVTTVTTAEELWDIVDNRLESLISISKSKLIVIDSIAAVFRTGIQFNNSKEDLIQRSTWLFSLAARLKQFAHGHECRFLITNQVSSNPLTGEVNPSLGLSWAHCISTRLKLSRIYKGDNEESNRRELRVIFSNVLPERKSTFCITKEGIQ